MSAFVANANKNKYNNKYEKLSNIIGTWICLLENSIVIVFLENENNLQQ